MMNRDAPTARAVALPVTTLDVVAWNPAWRRLLPLWRHAVWTSLVFALAAWALSVRLEVAGLQRDLARNARLEREAVVLNERLQLEWSVRRRTATIEAVAGTLGLREDVGLVRVASRP